MFFSHKLVELILEISRMDHILHRAIFGIKTHSLFTNIFWKLKHDVDAGGRGSGLKPPLVLCRFHHSKCWYICTKTTRLGSRRSSREFLVMRERDDRMRTRALKSEIHVRTRRSQLNT